MLGLGLRVKSFKASVVHELTVTSAHVSYTVGIVNFRGF